MCVQFLPIRVGIFPGAEGPKSPFSQSIKFTVNTVLRMRFDADTPRNSCFSITAFAIVFEKLRSLYSERLYGRFKQSGQGGLYTTRNVSK